MTAPAPSPAPSPLPPPGRSAQRRARWGRLAVGVSVLVLAAGGAGHALVARLDTAIGRVDPFEGLNDRPRSSGGLNFLLAGTDGREKLTEQERKRYHLGGAPCHCTDTIMLVHLSADRKRASVVSIPRDSYVQLPAHTDRATGERLPARPGKINAAYARGGPQLTVRTVEHMTGIHIDHYLEVDFTSFMRTVDVLGGVDICSVRPMKDSYTGLDLPAGASRLNGGQALQYVRSRHIDGAADLGRMQRQQRFLAALVDRVTSGGVLLNPVKFQKAASTLLGSVRADRGFGTDELLDLGRAMRDFGPASSEFTSVPIENAGFVVPGLGSTVKWDSGKAGRIFRALRADRSLAVHRPERERVALVDVAPGRVRVQVDNGTDRAGLARRVSGALRATGFLTTSVPGDAAVPARGTVVTYDPDWDRSARTVAAALPGADLRPVYGHGPVIRVTVGEDFRKVRSVQADGLAQHGTGAGSPGGTAVTGDQVICSRRTAVASRPG
ncbi:LCP family protein [Streptomyces sp. NPDC004647]|uniref:LCP family protein n=1 Tax=Streptomyces sp. NPDC004647 TaxID=3154671 RepID=UPI0033BD2B7C